jgi:hypothetical protein
MRRLKAQFLADLKGGSLHPFIECAAVDDALDIEIRDNYINIYYRGGNLFRISAARSGYKVEFDLNYLSERRNDIVNIAPGNYSRWVNEAPFLKSQMDKFFCKKRKLEREFQQLVVRENNRSTIARSTDYYIADIEYANSANGSRFDMLAIKWPAGNGRKSNINASLSFIEVKYGDAALKGDAGLEKHVEDIESFLENHNNRQAILKEMATVFNQKQELGLLEGIASPLAKLDDSNYEFILLLANHNPKSSILGNELRKLVNNPAYQRLENELDCKLKIATASLLGYGLYEEHMIPLEDFINAH